MKIGLVGPHGFLGRAFYEVLSGVAIVESYVKGDDLNKLANCDVIINANGNSSKIFAEQNPMKDFQDNALFTLSLSLLSRDTNALLVHISSGEVRQAIENEGSRENLITNLANQSNYTLSKTIGETLVRKHAKKWIIIRPSGLIGKGLQKGPVFDLLKGDPVWVHPRSTFRLMRTSTTAKLTNNLILSYLSEKSTNKTYELSGIDEISLEQIALTLEKPIITRPDLPIVKSLLDLESIPNEFELPSSLKELNDFVQDDLTIS